MNQSTNKHKHILDTRHKSLLINKNFCNVIAKSEKKQTHDDVNKSDGNKNGHSHSLIANFKNNSDFLRKYNNEHLVNDDNFICKLVDTNYIHNNTSNNNKYKISEKVKSCINQAIDPDISCKAIFKNKDKDKEKTDRHTQEDLEKLTLFENDTSFCISELEGI